MFNARLRHWFFCVVVKKKIRLQPADIVHGPCASVLSLRSIRISAKLSANSFCHRALANCVSLLSLKRATAPAVIPASVVSDGSRSRKAPANEVMFFASVGLSVGKIAQKVFDEFLMRFLKGFRTKEESVGFWEWSASTGNLSMEFPLTSSCMVSRGEVCSMHPLGVLVCCVSVCLFARLHRLCYVILDQSHAQQS